MRLPGGEIVPAMDRGLLDAAEFNNASSDRVLGFPDVSKVCMLQSFHQNAEQFEIMFNKTEVRRAAGQNEGDHRERRRGGVGRYVVEGGRPLLERLHRDADQTGREVLPHADGHPAAAADCLRSGGSEENRQTIHCSRKSKRRSARLPSARCAGISIPTSIGAWRISITSDRSPARHRRRLNRSSAVYQTIRQCRMVFVLLISERSSSATTGGRGCCRSYCWRSTGLVPGSGRRFPG